MRQHLLLHRTLRPGVKFADADLPGFPLQIRVGRRAAEHIVECKIRRTGAVIEAAAESLNDWIRNARRNEP